MFLENSGMSSGARRLTPRAVATSGTARNSSNRIERLMLKSA